MSDNLNGEREVLAAVRRYRFRFSSEAQLQESIEAALVDAELRFVREERLSPRDRIDFLCPEEGVGIEVKVDGSVAAVEAQLERYAQCDRVEELILVTACARHGRVARVVGGKTVHVVPTFAGGF